MHELGKLAESVGGRVVGDSRTKIRGIAGFFEAGPGDITFASEAKYIKELDRCLAEAVIVRHDVGDLETSIPLLLVDNPKYAYAKILSLFASHIQHYRGIHPSATVGKGVQFGANISIGSSATIGEDVSIGENTIVFPGVYIGDRVNIGKDSIIYPNAVIREDCFIGDRVIVGASSVIGSDGFGFVTIAGVHRKVPQIGSVVIEDDVELGANVCVDRATTGVTRVGKGTKVDNLVQIAHNVQVGSNVIIVAFAGIAGSSVLEDNVTLAAQAGVIDHCHVGRNTVVMARGLVTKDIPDGTIVSGDPAQPHRNNMRLMASLRKVPELIKVVGEMQSRLEELGSLLETYRQ
jgi:UDP-3-O-[3-hydroxymyristoyl] glucosamine N-acyltransferase